MDAGSWREARDVWAGHAESASEPVAAWSECARLSLHHLDDATGALAAASNAVDHAEGSAAIAALQLQEEIAAMTSNVEAVFEAQRRLADMTSGEERQAHLERALNFARERGSGDQVLSIQLERLSGSSFSLPKKKWWMVCMKLIVGGLVG